MQGIAGGLPGKLQQPFLNGFKNVRRCEQFSFMMAKLSIGDLAIANEMAKIAIRDVNWLIAIFG